MTVKNGEVMADENQADAFVSKSGFAALRGCSPSYITKLARQGRLILGPDGKLIDVKATIKLLQLTQDPAKDAVRMYHSETRVKKHVIDHLQANAPTDESAGRAADPQYWHNKSRREGALADLAELELAKQRGELVDRARVESAAFTISRALRDSVLGVPTRIAPELVGLTSFEIETKIRAALRQLFLDWSKMSHGDIERALEKHK